MSQERYVLVSSTLEQANLVKATDALESAGIPVIVQHDFNRANSQKSNYRLMVPDRYSDSANQVVAPLLLKSAS